MALPNRGYHSAEFKDKKRKLLLRRLYITLGVIVFLIVGSAGLTHWNKLQIQRISVQGTSILSEDEVRAAARNIISGNYYFVLAKNNALLYPRVQLEQDLPKQFPRIKDILVKLSDWQTIGIQLSERGPFALWCDTPPGATSTPDSLVPNCYFLDDTGFVFAPAPDFSGDAYFKYYGLLPYAAPIDSSYLASSDTFTKLSSFVAGVKALNITPLYIVAQSPDDFEMYIYGGGKIIFDDRTSLDKTAERLQLLLKTNNLIPEKNGVLQVDYIDLRYGNKLFYKIKSGTN